MFKMGKSSAGMKIMASTMTESGKVLFVLVFMILIAVIVFSSAVYSFEQSGRAAADFESIPRTFWWSLVTMTTVGYGDITPVTPWGRFIAVFTMFSGILIVALPITVIGANFEKQFEKQFFCDALVEEVVMEDGTVDYQKLMALFQQLDQRGNLLVPLPQSEDALRELVSQYDMTKNGHLDNDDWACLIMDCMCDAHDFAEATLHKVRSATSASGAGAQPHGTRETALLPMSHTDAPLGPPPPLAPVHRHRRWSTSIILKQTSRTCGSVWRASKRPRTRSMPSYGRCSWGRRHRQLVIRRRLT